MENKIVAEWIVKGGKTRARLEEFVFDNHPAFVVTGDYGSCNLGNNFQTMGSAIEYLETMGMIKYMRMDYPSLKKEVVCPLCGNIHGDGTYGNCGN